MFSATRIVKVNIQTTFQLQRIRLAVALSILSSCQTGKMNEKMHKSTKNKYEIFIHDTFFPYFSYNLSIYIPMYHTIKIKCKEQKKKKPMSLSTHTMNLFRCDDVVSICIGIGKTNKKKKKPKRKKIYYEMLKYTNRNNFMRMNSNYAI